MRYLIIISILFCSFLGRTQNIEETARKFWEAVKVWNDEKIISHGNTLITFVKENKLQIDSTIIEIRLYISDSHIHLNDPENALRTNLETLELVYKKWGRENQFYATLLNNIAMDYSYLGNDSLALKYNFEALLLKEIVYGKKDQSYALSLINTAKILAKNGDVQKAIKYNLEALEIMYASTSRTDAIQDEERQRILFLHQTVSRLYFSVGDYQKSIEHLIVITDYLEKKDFTEVDIFSTCLIDLIDCYHALGEKEKMSDVLVKFEKTIIFQNEKSDRNLISKLDLLADSYLELDVADKAIHYSLQILENADPYDSVKLNFIIKNFNRLSFCYELKGDLIEALKYENQNEKFIELAHLRSYDFDRYLTQLIKISSIKGENGLWLEARETLMKSGNKKITDNSLKALYLNTLANCEQQLANYDVSIKLYMEALELYEALYGINSTKYLKSLSNLGNSYLSMEQFDKALSIFLQVLELKLQILPKQDKSIGVAYNQLSVVYANIGKLDKAISYMFLAIEIDSLNYHKGHPLLAHDYLNLAELFIMANRPILALAYEAEALKILKNSLGKDNFEYACGLVTVASTCVLLGYIEKSLEFDLRALKVFKSLNLDSTLEYAKCLNAIGSDYSKLKKYSRSVKYYLKAADLIKVLLGENNSSYSICLNNIACAYYNLHKREKFQEYSNLYFQYSYNAFEKNMLGFSNSEQEVYKRKTLEGLEFLAQSKLLTNSKLDVIGDYWIKLNSLLSSSNRILTDKILSSTDHELRESFQQLTELRKQYIYSSETKKNPEKTQLLLEECEKLERVFWQKYPEFKEANREIKSGDIISEIKVNEVFVDIAKFHKFSSQFQRTDSSQYLVFISDFKDTLVDYVFIQDGMLMDQDLFDQYRQEATDPDRKTDLTSETFYNYFWKPIADKIGDAKTIYISLGGVYNNINLNTIYNPETGKYLLEEKDIRIVNSAREFIMNKERETKTYNNNTASLFGFPNFDGNTTVSADASDLFASTRDLNSFWLDSLTRGGLKAKPLPATKTEVENISATLKSKGWQVTNYLADNASETNLKSQQSPRVLHVATHGYFFPDIPMEDKDQTRFLGMDRQQVVQDPMLRSGLLLTGANRTLKGESSTGENGLLSAAEASLLDLRETELVVLSACETGKGEVKNSEGVYGLRKAFSDAGAQNIIMSLWKVDDDVTQEFMSRFYEIWLNDKTSIREAFNRTQLEIKAKYPQPYFWGAFILVGE